MIPISFQNSIYGNQNSSTSGNSLAGKSHLINATIDVHLVIYDNGSNDQLLHEKNQYWQDSIIFSCSLRLTVPISKNSQLLRTGNISNTWPSLTYNHTASALVIPVKGYDIAVSTPGNQYCSARSKAATYSASRKIGQYPTRINTIDPSMTTIAIQATNCFHDFIWLYIYIPGTFSRNEWICYLVLF